MSELATSLKWTKGSMKFIGRNAGGIKTIIDGDRQDGASPIELVLEALGSCPATDVVSIMEKMREPLTRLEIGLEADRHSPEPRYLTAVRVRFDAWGKGLNPEKVNRAIGLSFARYCSVFHTLRPDLKLKVEFRLHDADSEAAGEYELVELAAVVE